jgi:hypothetical protein
VTRLLYDSTNISDIPTSAPLVGFYVDGIYSVATATVRARFPNAVLVPISAIGSNAGIVGDVEPGCIAIGDCVNWVKARRAAGIDPTIYCNETYAWAGVRAAFQKAGVKEPHYWCANYDDHAELRPGQVARQYANPTLTGHHYDLSVVADHWPGVDTQGDDMPLSQTDADALIWRVETLISNLDVVPAGPTKGEKNALKAAQDALAAKVAAIPVTEPAETEPAPAAIIDPQFAADIHTLASLARKFGAA